MDNFLIVIGCQKEKLARIDKRDARNIIDFINSNAHKYSGGVVSIVRKNMNGDRNFKRDGSTMDFETSTYLSYESDSVIEVPGYDVDCALFRRDAHYDIIGISTSASVLCIAMSMYSQGLDVTVLKKYCADGQGKKLEDCAYTIMDAYMPGRVK